jgi:peptidyl-prolyl cis-trans isomerase B (cyclophilin B)
MWKTFQRWMVLVCAVSALVISGCTQGTTETSAANSSPSQIATATAQANGAQPSGLARLDGKAIVAMTLKTGTVTMELDGTNAPITAGNFLDLVQQGVYDGTAFHRVERDPEPFVVQGGDPNSKTASTPMEQLGTGSFIDPTTKQARYIPLEIKPEGAANPVYRQPFRKAGITAKPKLKHSRGAVAMARSESPDSASAQFYITLADVNFLDGNYAVFGTVTQGMEIVDKIQRGDRVESIKVVQGGENLKKG